MKSLQGVATQMKEMGVRVLGVSRDSVEDQAKFAKQCELEMPLLSDADGSVTDKYDCGFPGRPFSQRVTFVIDDVGQVRLRDESVSVRSHGPDLVAKIAELKGE
ncbi:MAG: redoxin domain-containing protein [Planctomycetota bacterium]